MSSTLIIFFILSLLCFIIFIAMKKNLNKSSRRKEQEIGMVVVLLLMVIFMSIAIVQHKKEFTSNNDREPEPTKNRLKKPVWQVELENNLSTVLNELTQKGDSIISNTKARIHEYISGGWIVVNQSDWKLSKECKYIKGEEVPKNVSDLAYVVVISPVRKKSMGYYKVRGSIHGPWEKFISEYTVYLIDWRNRCPIRSSIVTSEFDKDSWGGSEEDQDDPRRSILLWLYHRGVIDWFGGSWDRQEEYPLPLQKACADNDLDLAKYLIKKGADVSPKNGFNSSLEAACANNNLELVKLLRKHRIHVDEGYSFYKACLTGNLQLIEYLINEGADVNRGDPLFHFCSKGNFKLIKYLVERGADVNHGLQIACRNGYLEIVKYLVEKGADVDQGYTWRSEHPRFENLPIYEALENGYQKIAQILLKNGAKRDILVMAALGDQDYVKEVIKANSDLIHLESPTNNTPLHNAATCGQIDIVNLLISEGADIEAESKWNREWLAADSAKCMWKFENDVTPLHKAAYFGHYDIVELLLKAGADIEAETTLDWTPLHKAASNGQLKVVDVLIKNGASIYAHTRTSEIFGSKDKNPLELAICNSHNYLAELLQNYMTKSE